MQMKTKLLAQLHMSSGICLAGLRAGIAAVQSRARTSEDRSSFMVTVLPDLRPRMPVHVWHHIHVCHLAARVMQLCRHEIISIVGLIGACKHSHQDLLR